MNKDIFFRTVNIYLMKNGSHIYYLECLTELMRHNVIEDRVHGSGHVVQNARSVRQRFVHGQQDRTVRIVAAGVHRQEALRVERRPTDEERHHHCNCKT